MRSLLILTFLCLLQSPLLADQLKGPWEVHMGGVTHRDGSFSAGETTFVYSDGKVYYSTWSSGIAGPTKKLVGTAEPAAIQALSRELAELKKGEPEGEGPASLYLNHDGKATSWKWKGTPTPGIKKAVGAFQAAVKSAKK